MLGATVRRSSSHDGGGWAQSWRVVTDRCRLCHGRRTAASRMQMTASQRRPHITTGSHEHRELDSSPPSRRGMRALTRYLTRRLPPSTPIGPRFQPKRVQGAAQLNAAQARRTLLPALVGFDRLYEAGMLSCEKEVI